MTWSKGNSGAARSVAEHRIVITAPIELVWDVTIGIASWPLWCPTVSKVQLSGAGPFCEGSQFRLKQPLQRMRLWEVDRLEPPLLAQWRTIEGVPHYRACHTLSACDGGTISHLHLVAPSLGRCSSCIARPVLRVALAAENRALKKTCEVA